MPVSKYLGYFQPLIFGQFVCCSSSPIDWQFLFLAFLLIRITYSYWAKIEDCAGPEGRVWSVLLCFPVLFLHNHLYCVDTRSTELPFLVKDGKSFWKCQQCTRRPDDSHALPVGTEGEAYFVGYMEQDYWFVSRNVCNSTTRVWMPTIKSWSAAYRATAAEKGSYRTQKTSGWQNCRQELCRRPTFCSAFSFYRVKICPSLLHQRPQMHWQYNVTSAWLWNFCLRCYAVNMTSATHFVSKLWSLALCVQRYHCRTYDREECRYQSENSSMWTTH